MDQTDNKFKGHSGMKQGVMPAIFFGHGNPMNALLDNNYTQAWQRIGQQTTKPRAILSISAHWSVPETGVTVSTAPRTIHDFVRFESEAKEMMLAEEYKPLIH